LKKVKYGQIKTLVIKIHSYLGLLCMPYLLIFGLSSLTFNHHFEAFEVEGREGDNELLKIDIPAIDDNLTLANAINDSCSVFGWYLPWSARRDSLQFFYETVKTGRKYNTKVDFESGEIKINSRRNSISHLLKGLHGLGEEIPNAPLCVNVWQYYQDLSVYSLMFWLLSGIWLWIQKRIDRRWGSIILLTFFMVSIFLMLFIWLVG
jgi:hypothetical protein